MASKSSFKIEDFYNYRAFLKNYLTTAQVKNSKFSIGAWSKKLNFTSTAALAKILSGEREMSDRQIESLIKYFGFSKSEELSFRSLVSISKMKISEEDKAQLCRKIYSQTKHKRLRSRRVALDQYHLFSSYVPFAVYELAKLPKMNLTQLKARLITSTHSEIVEAVKTLHRLDLVRVSPEGDVAALKLNLETTDDVESSAIRHYHRGQLALATQKIDDTPMHMREFQSLLFLMSTKNLARYKSLIREFIQSLEIESENEPADALYSLQVQLYPLTRIFPETRLAEDHLAPGQIE